MGLRKSTRYHVLAHVVLVGLGMLVATPFAWLLSTSVKVDSKIFAQNTELIPRAPFVTVDGREVRVRLLKQKDEETLVQAYKGNKLTARQIWVRTADIRDKVFFNVHNYTEALKSGQDGSPAFDFLLYLRNTLRLCLLGVFGTVLSCSLVAYGLACVNWRGREALFWIMLATMMLPGQVTMIPVFLTFKKLGWIGTILPLVVPTFLGNAFFIFLLRQFYRSIPAELVEAARIDGCSDLGIWWRIMLPLSKPALAVVGLFTFIGTWNDFLGPLIYLIDNRQYTLSIGLAMFQGQYGGQWGEMMAMSTLMLMPIVILFFFTQKTFIQGVKLSGIKG
jgi:multiple sugar transport system permease protein